MPKEAKTQVQPSKSLGPVSDLERHLPTDWWRTLFNSVYLRTDGDVVENRENTERDVTAFLESASPDPNDRILDLCCGQGRHCLELARRGFSQVSGLDRSRYLVRLARRRATEESVKIAFHEGDARRFRLPENHFHYVTLFGNSFGYFDRQEDDLAVLKSVKRVLIPSGTIFLDITDGNWMREHFERRSWEWIDEQHLVCRERSLGADGQRLVSREVVVHAERGIIVDQFYAERLYDQTTINQLLEDAGYENVRHHGIHSGVSDRNQDLGLMAHRMLITAQARKSRVKPKKKGVKFGNVTVLMGDPSLPDTVKRGGQFNPEDMDTIDRLRKALDEIGVYELNYFDNHGAMLNSLRTNPPEFVLNLCDEGFNNDAFKELHVPAYLEMLGIPYSGAGPACLGLCYNKALVRAVAEDLDIPVPLETYFDPDDQSATIPSSFPALVKPNYGDSSIGITKDAVVRSPDQLMAYIRNLQDTLPGRPLLVQEYLTGSEYSVGVVGNPGLTYRVLPVLEVDYGRLPKGLPPILGYESKWHPDSPYWNDISYKEAKLSEEKSRAIQDCANLLFERLQCRDYARFDFRADDSGTIKLLEANPNPGWSWDAKMNLMAGFAGLRYADLLRMIIEAAQERYAASAASERV